VPIDWTEYFTEDELEHCPSVIKFGFTTNKFLNLSYQIRIRAQSQLNTI